MKQQVQSSSSCARKVPKVRASWIVVFDVLVVLVHGSGVLKSQCKSGKKVGGQFFKKRIFCIEKIIFE